MPEPLRRHLLSKELRRRSSLSFQLLHARNLSQWTRAGLEREAWSQRARDLTWQLIDLDEQIRQLTYGFDYELELSGVEAST